MEFEGYDGAAKGGQIRKIGHSLTGTAVGKRGIPSARAPNVPPRPDGRGSMRQADPAGRPRLRIHSRSIGEGLMSGPPKCIGGGRSGSNPRIIPIALYGLRVGAVHRDSSGSVTSRQSSKPAGRCSPSVGRFDSCAASLGGKARGCAEARRPCQAIVTTELVHMSAYESTVFALSRTPFALSRQRLRPCAIRFRSYSVAL